MKKFKTGKNTSKGITLIALVITIIVLLILAGVSIATLTGENGVLKQATNAGIKTDHASVLEHLKLEVNSYAIDKNTNVNPITLVGYLQSKGIIGDEIGDGSGKYQINVETLTGKTQKYGNGTATESEKNDVYMLEKVDTLTGNLKNKKVASIAPIKLAAKTSEIATYKILYYSTTSDFFNVGNLDNIEETVPSINVVKFTINGTEYQAEKGETWEEWIPKNPDVASARKPEYTLANALQMSIEWSQGQLAYGYQGSGCYDVELKIDGMCVYSDSEIVDGGVYSY